MNVLPCLAIVVLYRYTVSYPVLEVLSRFPALKVIRTEISPLVVSTRRGHYPPTCTFEDGSFQKLTALTVSGCSHQVSEIIDDKNFPSYIESLTIERLECVEDPSHSPDYAKIVAKVPRVTKFELREIMRGVSSPFASLRPFLSYNLTELRMETCLALTYSTAEIGELVHALPIIEVLSLNPRHAYPVRLFGTFTFNHLQLFARHCPKLTHLGIMLNTSYPCDAPRDGAVPFSVLKELELGVSFWSLKLSDGAASLLAQVLPNNCKLTFELPIFDSPFDPVLSEFLTDFVRNRTVRFLRNFEIRHIDRFFAT
ncbi:hypothetical protein C0992_010016 [Termitomyces sp. T32_za158]|nr:hypothetical protein C0992_010016 [Termitomyces sp. T32_za158]